MILIDDKLSYLSSVKTSLQEVEIAFHGYQYRGVEKLPGELDAEIAEVQFSYLRKRHKWLSDSDAQESLNANQISFSSF